MLPALESAAWIFSTEFIDSDVAKHIATTDAVYDFLEELTHLFTQYVDNIKQNGSDALVGTPLSTLLFLISEERMPQLFEPYALSLVTLLASLIHLAQSSIDLSTTIQIYTYRALTSLLSQQPHSLTLDLLPQLQIASHPVAIEIGVMLKTLPHERCKQLIPDCKSHAPPFLAYIRCSMCPFLIINPILQTTFI